MKVAKNVPLRIKVADTLREMIRTEYPNGEQIPNENELAEIIGVSRGTISQALSILTSEGLIVRKQGAGTFTNPNILRLNVRADLPFQLSELIENAGYQASVRLLDHQLLPADQETASALQIPPQSDVLVVRRVYLADGEPAIYLVDQISSQLVSEPYQAADLEKLLFHFLRDQCGVSLGYTLSNLIPSRADQEIAGLLQIDPGTALLKCQDTHYDRENQPVVHSTLYYSDQKLRFSVMRRYL